MSVFKSQVTDELSTRKHFAMVPNELYYAKISLTARAVWAYLASEGPDWKSSIANIGRNMGIHRNTVGRAIKKLISVNMLSTHTTDAGTEFTLHAPNSWTVEFRTMPQHLFEARAAHKIGGSSHSKSAKPALLEGGIQESKNPNTSKTTERKRSRSEVRKDVVGVQETTILSKPTDTPDEFDFSLTDLDDDDSWKDGFDPAILAQLGLSSSTASSS